MPHYPFVPKSNRYLHAGQFFAVPLSDGRYAAGRVTAVPALGPSDRTGIVVGLVDWVGAAEPTAADIAGRSLLVQATSRYDTITATGGAVLGERPLDLDGIEPIDPNDRRGGTVVTVWGRNAIRGVAEKAFVLRAPVAVQFFVDFPTRERAEAAARKLTVQPEISANGSLSRLTIRTETTLPISLAEGQYRDTANMLDGAFAGIDLT